MLVWWLSGVEVVSGTLRLLRIGLQLFLKRDAASDILAPFTHVK